MSCRIVFVAVAAVLGLSAATASAENQTYGNNGVTRTLDEAAGTNTSGQYPLQSDGMPGNPPGTATERALDSVAGTNTSGAYPLQSDGMPGNPPGTAVSRAIDAAEGQTGTN